eukprot:GDKK01065747.1.p2 GENE.GDKK01065747.1~~GDKK01065747.1.p2  ORF type:complete len:100 (-),score=5.37 GDKK01065747.1:73-348(-)
MFGKHVYQRLTAAEYKAVAEKGLTVMDTPPGPRERHVPFAEITRTGQILEKLFVRQELAEQYAQNKISTSLVGHSMAHGLVDTKMSLLVLV